jgi:CHAT domain-containing protein
MWSQGDSGTRPPMPSLARTTLVGLILAASPLFTPAHAASPGANEATQTTPPTECEEAVTADPADREAWRCFYLWARRSGAWLGAQTRLESALVKEPDNAHARLNLGHLFSDQGDAAAEPHYIQAAARYGATGDAVGEVHAQLALANLHAHLGHPPDSIQDALDAAARVAEAHGEPQLQAKVDAQSARQLWRQGADYARAYRLIRQAEARAFPDGPYQLQLLVLHVLAGICRETDRLDEAYAASQRLVDLSAAAGDKYVEATARLNVAEFATSHPERVPPTTAVEQAAAALAAAEASGNPYALAGAACVQGQALDLLGEDSLPSWKACAEGFAALGEPLSQTMGDLGAAGALAKTDPAAGAALAAGAVSRARATGDEIAEVMARFAEAVLLWEAEGPEAGEAAFGRHADAVARLQAHQADANTRAEVTAGHIDGHHHHAARLATQKPPQLDAALAAIEDLRAQALVDAMRAGREASSAPELDAIATQLSRLNTLLADTSADPPLDETAREALTLQRDVLEKEEAAQRDTNRQATLDRLGVAKAPTLAALQEQLGEGEVLVSFQVPPRQQLLPSIQAEPWALVVSRDRVARVGLPSTPRLTAAALTFAGMFQDEDPAAADVGHALWLQLLQPALDAIDHEGLPTRLVLVPDGPLHSLPFAGLRPAAVESALDDSVPGDSVPGGGLPLGEQVALSRAPSLTTWLALRQATADEPTTPSPALILGAPAWPSAAGDPLPDLPAAAEEARAVAAALGTSAAVHIEKEAKESRIKALISPPSLLHLAAHAQSADAAAGRHAVVLAEGEGEDGLLQAREVAVLPLDGSIVLLSACRGAAGRVLPGDGLQGLSRAFLVAGAPVVVGSLWPVPDDAAAAFIPPLARALAKGESVDVALSIARAERRAAGDNPSAWAGFVAIGDGTRALTPREPALPPWAPWITRGLALVVALAGVFVLGRGIRRRPQRTDG